MLHKVKMHKRNMLSIAAVAFISGAASVAHAETVVEADVAPATLSETKATISSGSASIDARAIDERDLRSKAMKEAANSYGARSGLLRGAYENRKLLEKVSNAYDSAYNFTPLMLIDTQPIEKGGDGRPRLIRPPVIAQAKAVYNQLDPMMIRERDTIYRIESNVEFVPAPPNWRTYLFRDYGEKVAAPPHYTLRPKSSEEKTKWDQWVAEGWDQGYRQARDILESDLKRLQRDFDGMVLYYDLVNQNVLSLPYVATNNSGVTGDNTQMNVNDVTLRITVIPAFQRQTSNWKATSTSGMQDIPGQKPMPINLQKPFNVVPIQPGQTFKPTPVETTSSLSPGEQIVKPEVK